jgi:hypothetical protein
MHFRDKAAPLPQCIQSQQTVDLKFYLATEPAIKATIAIVACTSIAYVTTHAQNWFGVIAALIIGVISVVIVTYKTPPPLCCQILLE